MVLLEDNFQVSAIPERKFSENQLISLPSTCLQQDNVISTNDITYNKTWTYMLYLDADNDIEGDAIRDFEWLEEAGGSDENISIVVLLDRIPGYDETHGGWAGSRIYNITADVSSLTIDSQLMVDLGEVDMASTTTLTNFITYCFDNFPAENYILDLWNHGHAAYGVIDDETSGSHFIVNDVQTAINNALAVSTEEIDIISMDACNMMTLEVAWELRDLCNYFIASEDGTNGYPYNSIIQGLKMDPNINPSSFCELMVDAYGVYYQYTMITCLSVINQTKLLELPGFFNSFVSELISTLELGNYSYLLALSRDLAYAFYDGSWVDFVSLIENILFFFDRPALNLVSEDLLEFLNQLIISNWQHNGYTGNANGITIFMPVGTVASELIETYYQRDSFCAGMDWQLDTLWDEFLDFYLDHNWHLIIIDPQTLSLDEVMEDCIIGQNRTQLFRFNLWKKSLYEISCLISSGDIDFKVIKFDYMGEFEYIGGSFLVNPDDGSTEKCRFMLESGFYYILVYGKASTSNYEIGVKYYDAINLVCNSPNTQTAGSMNGDDYGHFKQDLNFYYKIDIPYGNNTITLTNSATANYQITIFDENWIMEYFLPAEGFGEVLTIIYVYTGENPITFYLEICGYEGAGEFTIEILNPNEPTPTSKVKLSLLMVLVILPFITIISRKKSNH
ncbi:MAG: clostripain-related cysteine peptidase [Candidatus Heimdallarchaeota archaeon]